MFVGSPSSYRPQGAPLDRSVLVLAPVEGDSESVIHVLSEGGYLARGCRDIADVATNIARDGFRGAGTVILAQEAFSAATPEQRNLLASALSQQPEWSDLPLILLAGGLAEQDVAWGIARTLDPVGNITILERPLRRTTLLNAIAVALRARMRQYQLREMLAELAAHRDNLRTLVDQRTAALAASMASLRASERLASLGTLAAGLGHDIANLTLPIRTRLDMLRAGCANEEGRADIDAIGVALTHLTRLSAGMRLMGMDPERASASSFAVDLSNWEAETIPLLRAALPRHIQLECRVEAGLGVSIARHRLAQAVLNLVQNAGEAMAMQASGTVCICADAARTSRGEPAVRIRVSDNGPGMNSEVMSRCFEPYFSTKGRSIATGMGLGMVKGIVEAARGTIGVESAPGRGTTFTLLLPAAPGAGGASAQSAPVRTGVISLADSRIAGLARMFIEQMDWTCVRHEGAESPSGLLWVVDDCEASVDGFLEFDPRRRAVILLDQEESSQPKRDRFARLDRLTVLPKRPAPSVLRDAIVRDAVDARVEK